MKYRNFLSLGIIVIICLGVLSSCGKEEIIEKETGANGWKTSLLEKKKRRGKIRIEIRTAKEELSK